MKCTSGCERSSSRATAMMNSCPFCPLSSAPTWPTTNLPRELAADRSALAASTGKPAAAAVHDAHRDRGVVGANDFRHLRRDGRDARRAAIRLVREPMLANRIVDAPRDHVRRARQQRAQERRVDAAAFVDVDQRRIARRARHRQEAAADLANLDVEVAQARGKRRPAPRDQRLLHVAAREPANQELGLPLTAAIAPSSVDVNDLRWHRPRARRLRYAAGRSVAQRRARRALGALVATCAVNSLKCRHSAALASAENIRCAASSAEPILIGTTPPRWPRSRIAAPTRASSGSKAPCGSAFAGSRSSICARRQSADAGSRRRELDRLQRRDLRLPRAAQLAARGAATCS